MMKQPNNNNIDGYTKAAHFIKVLAFCIPICCIGDPQLWNRGQALD